ncbi:MAG TPA: hypothetical protein VFI90_06450 [Rubrobacter sp.]|nr:hypothetical protein [Rubrobacter sp.]
MTTGRDPYSRVYDAEDDFEHDLAHGTLPRARQVRMHYPRTVLLVGIALTFGVRKRKDDG